jgi:hypothetical protein
VGLKDLINFLNKLEVNNIFYKLNKVRNDAIMVEIAVPGQRWEVEFMADGTVRLKNLLVTVISDMKKTFVEVIKAKKEALASLEKARGEMATSRSLANAAKMMEKNPELVKLRLIQTIDSSQGNTFIIDTKMGCFGSPFLL